MKKEEIERGVVRIKPPKDSRGYKNGDIYLYKLSEMSDEAIAKYGLSSVKKRLSEYSTESMRLSVLEQEKEERNNEEQ